MEDLELSGYNSVCCKDLSLVILPDLVPVRVLPESDPSHFGQVTGSFHCPSSCFRLVGCSY